MEVSFVSLLNCNQFGWWVEEEEEDPTPTHPTPKWSSTVGKMSNEEEEEDDPHPLPTPPPQWAVKSSAFLLSFLTVSCEEFYILAWSLFTLGRCGETLYCSASILRPQGVISVILSFFTSILIFILIDYYPVSSETDPLTPSQTPWGKKNCYHSSAARFCLGILLACMQTCHKLKNPQPPSRQINRQLIWVIRPPPMPP